ncbi:MAG: sigma 54-interacting transcriptional regulator, partial [Deltaproteobacteria bacterium]|nr:sigma 54-interacting transcriptional regulator [Deltaproteobacteria bacterium]
YRYRHPERGQVWFRHSARVLERDPAGRTVRSLGVIHDVTDQKSAEEELRRSLEEVRRLRDEYQQQNLYLREQMKEDGIRGAIVGESEPVLKMLSEARRVAPTGAGVLITGETGTGKELLAEAIHEMSSRSGKPMVKVNCAALPATLIESELFGREKGAYTGALTQQVGRFELADGSTLFLDEIAELPPELQAKLLRVLQEGQFERLGGRRTYRVDVRVIAATNRDLPALVQQGRFRADLFYRLNVFPIVVPPLRERQGDVATLVWHFVRHFSQKMGKTVDTIPRRTLEEFQRQPWPGNVRELRNLIERSVILSDTRTLHVEFGGASPADTSGTRLEDVERQHILRVLERAGWHIRGPHGAAALLDLVPTTLHSKLKKLGITRPKF